MVIRTKNADGGTEKHRTLMTFAVTENERTVTGMAEYIECRNCDSHDCKGCNLKNLETMLNNGKFDCLMKKNRCINPSEDVATVRHGRWIDAYPDIEPNPMFMYGICSECGFEQGISKYLNYCPNCGAKMAGE